MTDFNDLKAPPSRLKRSLADGVFAKVNVNLDVRQRLLEPPQILKLLGMRLCMIVDPEAFKMARRKPRQYRFENRMDMPTDGTYVAYTEIVNVLQPPIAL